MRQRVPAAGAEAASAFMGIRASHRHTFAASYTVTALSIALLHSKSFFSGATVRSSDSPFGAHSYSVYSAMLSDVPMNASTTSRSHSPMRSPFCAGSKTVSFVNGHS